MSKDTWTPQYSRWRHGGWYVNNVRYASGACGCVSNNYDDKKWRIICGDDSVTFPSRDAAARAEKLLASASYTTTTKKYSVLMMLPDYLANEFGHETYLTHVEAENAYTAQWAGREQAARDLTDPDDVADTIPPEDFFVVLLCEGHIEDIKFDS